MNITLGQKYGMWEVIGPVEAGKVLVRCECARTEHKLRVYDLESHKSLMCRKCSVALTKTTHGSANNANVGEYTSWMHMIQRTTNPNCKDFKNYGGRGITVCDLWKDSFEAFLLMMGPKPTSKHTIERIDTSKNYEPDNCIWATRTEQNRNTRSNVRLTIDNETKVVSEWASHPSCTVSQFVIYKRLKRNWEPKEAVFAPSGCKKGQWNESS